MADPSSGACNTPRIVRVGSDDDAGFELHLPEESCLDRLPRRLESFAYSVSHDLAAPLRAISVSVDLIARRLEKQLTPDTAGLLRFASEGATRMQAMIEGLTNVALIRRRHKPQSTVPLDAVLEAALQANAGEAMATGARVESVALPPVAGDPIQLLDAFSELLTNGLKFASPERSPRIEIRSMRLPRLMLIAFRDNGIGVPAKKALQIFEPFSKLNGHDEFRGVGVGLARCREIAEAHGGFTYAYPNAEPEHGATVVFAIALEQKEMS